VQNKLIALEYNFNHLDVEYVQVVAVATEVVTRLVAVEVVQDI